MGLMPRVGYEQDHEAYRESVRKFLAAEVVPHLDDWRRAGGVPATFFESAGRQGLVGTAVPEEFHGGGVDDPRFAAVLVEEAMSVGAAGLAAVLARHNGVCIPAVMRLPHSDQRSSWLAGMAQGALIGSATLLSPELTAKSVPGAALASVFICGASTPTEPRVFALPRVAVDVQPVLNSLGCQEAASGDIQLEVSSALPGNAVEAAAEELERDLNVWSAVLSVAGARSALELTLEYVFGRKVFGRPVAEFENTRFRLAEVAAGLSAAEALTSSCLTELAEGTLGLAKAAAARLTAGQIHDRAVDQGMQLHGGYGYMLEYPISHAFSDARYLRITSSMGSEPRHLVASAIGL